VGIFLQAQKRAWFLTAISVSAFHARGLEEGKMLKEHRVHQRKTTHTLINVSVGKQDLTSRISQ